MSLPPAAKLAVLATVLISALASAAAQEPTILRESSSVAWPVPRFSAGASTQCDADGNVYFRLFPSDGLLKVAHDGSKYHLYELPAGDSDSKHYGFVEFNVTPSGDLRVLSDGSGGAYYVLLLDPDFSGGSKTKLETPEHLSLNSFAAFESGAMLVTGHFNRHADKESQGKTYTAMFEPSGKLRSVIAGHFGDVDLASVGKKLPEGGAALGEDGFLYLLRSDEVVVISESGTIVRRMPLKKPAPELLATRIGVSGGLLSVELEKDQGLGKVPERQYLVLTASRGDRVGLYQPGAGMGAVLCFSRGTGFAFLTVRDEKFGLVTAPLR